MEVRNIDMGKIEISELNTRKDLNAGTEDTSIDDLADSIREKGLLNPIIVRPIENGKYSLIAGQRRFLACKKNGWQEIPAIIREILDDTDATIISLIENIHRADMNPIDKARAYQKIYEKYPDLQKVVKETGVSVTTIRKYLTLLNLAPSIQEKLSTSDGPAGIGTLSRIASTFSPEEQEEVLDSIGGFKQQIQIEIIKRSGGDLGEIEKLRSQAFEGAFDTHICHSLDNCAFIPDELIEPIKMAIDEYNTSNEITDFKQIVRGLK